MGANDNAIFLAGADMELSAKWKCHIVSTVVGDIRWLIIFSHKVHSAPIDCLTEKVLTSVSESTKVSSVQRQNT